MCEPLPCGTLIVRTLDACFNDDSPELGSVKPKPRDMTIEVAHSRSADTSPPAKW